MFTQVCDELGGVGVTVSKDDLVRITLLGLPKSWHNYLDLVNEREKLPNREHLWYDLVHEEIKENAKCGTSFKGKDEENFSLVGKGNKGKGKKSQTRL